MKRTVLASDIQEYSRVLTSALTSPTPFSQVGIKQLITGARANLQPRLGAIQGLLAFEHDALRDAMVDPTRIADVIEHLPIALASTSERSVLADLMNEAGRGLDNFGEHTMLRHYGGVYFSFLQAASLDSLSELIWKLDDSERDTALAALLGVASEISSTVGNHFAQPIRPRQASGGMKSGWVSTVYKRRSMDVLGLFGTWLSKYATASVPKFHCEARTLDFRTALDTLDSSVGAIYADPPYTRDHYSRFYHVLETLALGDEPGISTSKIAGRINPSRGLYREHRHQSPFSIKSEVKPAFEHIFATAQRLGAPLVLSYSPSTSGTIARPQTRLVTISDLVSVATPYFREVKVESAGLIAHSKFNRLQVNTEVEQSAEVFIVGTH